jgi:hypothetical protein
VAVSLPNGVSTWANARLGNASDGNSNINTFSVTQVLADLTFESDVTPVPNQLGTLYLNPLTPHILEDLALTGTNFYVLATALEYQQDSIYAAWLPVDPFTEGYSWSGGGPAAQSGTHWLRVRDANNPTVISNIQSYYLSALTLNPISALANVAPSIGGGDYEATGVADGLQYQLNGTGPWADVPGFVPAPEINGAWTGLGPAEPPGLYSLQVRNTAVPANVSNPVSYAISQNGGTYESLPVWSVQPDWANSVTERLEWLTGILRSPTGAEQRIAQRVSPRRTFETQLVIVGPERTLYDLGLKSQGASDWYVPIWTDVVRLQDRLTGDTFAVDTAGHEYVAGALLLLYGDPFNYEIAVIASVQDDSLTLAAAPVNIWPFGTRVLPLFRASFSTEPNASRFADRAFTASIAFTSQEAQDFTPSDAGLDTYDGFAVLTDAPDEAAEMTYKFDRLVTELDSKVGLRLVVDTAGFGFGGQQYAWFVQGYEALAALRGLLYYLQGRLTPIWLPTYFADLDLANPIALSDTTLTIATCGYTLFGCSRLIGRQNIRIELFDGTSVYCKITGSAQAGAQEVLSLSQPVGQDIALNTIRRVSFLALSRLDTDSLELTHYAAGGVVSATAVFREAPDLRQLVWTVMDPAKATGGRVSQGGGYFRTEPTDGFCIVKSVVGKTSGKWWVECAISQPSVQNNAMFGVALLSATASDLSATGTNAAVACAGRYAVAINVNGTNVTSINSGLPAESFLYVGAAIDLDLNKIWFVSLFDQTTVEYNNDPSADPGNNLGGIDISFRGTDALYLLAAIGFSGDSVGSNATINAGQGVTFNPAPANFTAGWSNP